jgi:hypothetical protein
VQTNIQYVGLSDIPTATVDLFRFIVKTLSLIQVTFKRLNVSYFELYNILCVGFIEIKVFNLIDHVLIGTPSIRPIETDHRSSFIENIIMEHNEIEELHVADVDCCFDLNDLQYVFQVHPGFSLLVKLHIYFLVQNEVLFQLSSKLRTLTCLSIKHGWSVSDLDLRDLLIANKMLSDFECVGCCDLTDDTMITLLNNCKYLRSFRMNGSCTTYSGLVNMVKGLKFLTCVNFDCIDDMDGNRTLDVEEIISIGTVVNSVKIQFQSDIIGLSEA